jgi:opacity protein-like surface antigen
MRRLVLLLLSISLGVAATSLPAAADVLDAPLNACTTQNPAFTTDDLSGIQSPCAALPGTLLVETLYFQNASRVGGTALAAYPLFRLRSGIVHRLEAIIDTPSQVAESGLRGAGLYPMTRIGYGLNYTFAESGRVASSVGLELVPPGSRFNVNESQPRYVIDMTTGFRVTDRMTLSAIATGTSSSNVGFERVNPAAALRVAYATSARTQVSADLGSRIQAHHGVAQNYGDVAVNQRLHKNTTFAVGLGTTFNPVSNAKAHYLASGFNFHL